MPNENVGPRMAVTLDGEVLFFDEKGTKIKKLEKMNQDQFIDLINNNELRSVQTISVYTFGPGSECKIVIVTPYGTFCFWVECETGRYIRPCRPGE
jgi:hypothetical protein